MAIEIYSTRLCPYCDRAKQLLTSYGASYEEIRIDQDAQQREIMINRSQRRTVPQIFIHGHHVGGFDDLKALAQAGALERLLSATS